MIRNTTILASAFFILFSGNPIAKELTDCSVTSFSGLFDSNETNNSMRTEALRCHKKLKIIFLL